MDPRYLSWLAAVLLAANGAVPLPLPHHLELEQNMQSPGFPSRQTLSILQPWRDKEHGENASGVENIQDIPSGSRFATMLKIVDMGKEGPESEEIVNGMMAESVDIDENSRDELQDTNPSTEKSDTHSKSFSVQIGEDQFYGGLITYSHEQHPARVCRVMNACVRPDGTLVLPEWMRRHDNTLNFHCGQSKLEFSLPDTSPPPPLKAVDLVGLQCPRPSMPDFLHDFMRNAVVFDLVYGDHQVSKSCHSRKGMDCDPFPGLAQDFRPIVFLHPRLKVLNEKKSWVRQFVKLMKPPKVGKQAEVMFGTTPDDSDLNMQCFRSGFFTRGPHNKNVIMEDHLRNIHFLEMNGIRRKPSRALRTMSRKGKQRKICNLNVTISNRKLVDGAHNRLIGRYIVNIPELRKAISQQVKRIRGLTLRVATMTLEGRSLWWQINGMQKTDIWVAGQGSLLTNMIFLRENSTVMEIQPFAYYPKAYENMARYLAHVKYDRYIAHPDIEAFKTCLHQLYPKGHASFENASNVLLKFSKAAEKYAQSDSTHSLTLQNFNDSSLQHVKTCAQMQRLDTNAKNLAIAIVRHARLRCGFPKPDLDK